MTKFPIRTVARKYGTHAFPATHRQSHMDSIHSPQRTRNTIIKLCKKSVKFHRGSSQSHFSQTNSVQSLPNSCIPITANMNTMIQRTNVKLDRAPTVFAMIVKMSFSDFHDLANLKTRRRRNERNMDNPFTPSRVSSTRDRTTIKKSKQFHPS